MAGLLFAILVLVIDTVRSPNLTGNSLHIIVRDDDISAVTRPDMLETLYSRIWAVNKPVCFSVIPSHACNVKLSYLNECPEWDLNVPPALRGKPTCLELQENEVLCNFLRRRIAEGKVEISLHGLHHVYKEFASGERGPLSMALKEGLTILKRTLPDAHIATFVAPYDDLSKSAVEAVFGEGLNLSAPGSKLKSLGCFPGSSVIAEYERQGLDFYVAQAGNRFVYSANCYLFDPLFSPDLVKRSIEQALKRPRRSDPVQIIICVNHYWSFFCDWGKPDPHRLEVWHQFLDIVLSDSAYELTTFSQLSNRFASENLFRGPEAK